MKKTLIALIALAGVATAAETYVLDMKDITFNGAEALTGGNQAMTWDSTEVYDAWYAEFTIGGTGNGYTSATITTGPSGSPAGLSVIVQQVNSTAVLSFGNGKSNLNDTPTLNYSTTDVLTFAFYEDTAYIGNKTTGDYITYDLTGTTLTTSMTSGTSRAWANGNPGITPVSSASIANLESLVIPEGESLDMVTLVTTGVAQNMQLVPEPTTATLSLLALAGLAARRRRK